MAKQTWEYIGAPENGIVLERKVSWGKRQYRVRNLTNEAIMGRESVTCVSGLLPSRIFDIYRRAVAA